MVEDTIKEEKDAKACKINDSTKTGKKVISADHKQNSDSEGTKISLKRKTTSTNADIEKKTPRKKRKYTRTKKSKIAVDYNQWYESRKKKFGWGVDDDQLTKEQLQ